jgi:hypothetical protein
MQKHRPLYITKHNVSPAIGTSSIDWAQLSRFYLKTETDSSLRNVVLCNINRAVYLHKDRTIDNVQKHNIYTNVPPSKTLDLINECILCGSYK